MPLPGDLATVLTATPVQTSAYTAKPGEFVRTDTTNGSLTVTLPSSPPANTVIGVKQIAVTSPYVTTVACSGADAFNNAGGGTTLTLTLSGQGAQVAYRSGVWLVTSDDLPLSQLDARYGGGSSAATFASTAALNATLGTYDLDSYAGTDDQKMAAALTAVFAASPAGGTITLSARAHTFANQWVTAYAAGVVTSLRITGAGAAFDGAWATGPGGATAVTFTYAGAGAGCMAFQHLGSIEIDHVWFKSANAGVPLFYTQWATPMLHDNVWSGGGYAGLNWATDAIVLGGNTAGTYFQGYGADIRRNFFDGIRRCVQLGGAANAVGIRENTVSLTCGDTALFGAPFVAAGSSVMGVYGLLLHHNLIEMVHYQALVNATGGYLFQSHIGPNTTWDSGTYVLAKLDTTCAGNYIDDTAYRGNPAASPAVYAPGVAPFTEAYTIWSGASCGSTVTSPTFFQAPVIASPNYWFGISSGYGDQAQLMPVSYATNPSTPSAMIQCKGCTIVTDGVTVNLSPIFTSVTAAFTTADIGAPLACAGFTGGFIVAVYGPSSWQIAWQPGAAVAAGQLAVPPGFNGHLYQCTAAGTTAAAAPAWPTSGGTVTDGTVTWKDLGTSVTAAETNGHATASAAGVTLYFGARSAASAVNMTRFTNHHILGSGGTPTWTAAGAGAGYTAVAAGTDLGQILTLTTGTGSAAGIVLTGAAHNTLTAAAGSFAVTAGNAAAAALMTAAAGAPWIVMVSNTGWALTIPGTPADATVYKFHILTLG